MIKKIPPAGNPPPINLLLRSFFAGQSVDIELIAHYLGCKNIVFFPSGRMALFAILQALKKLYSPQKKIILPAYTCPVIVETILKAGLVPLPCELEKDSLFMKKSEVEKLYDKNTLGIIAVHLFGYPHPVWREFRVIEDAAQALGSETPTGKIGTLGEACFFSLGKGKNLTTDKGGIVITKNEDLFKEIRKLSPKIPMSPLPSFLKLLIFRIVLTPLGWKVLDLLNLPKEESSSFQVEYYNLSSFHLKLLEAQLPNYEKLKAEKLKKAKIIMNYLSQTPYIKTFPIPPNTFPSLPRLPFLVKEGKRKRIKSLFHKRGWEVTTMYKKILPEIYPFLPPPSNFPNALSLSRELLTLPLTGYFPKEFFEDWEWIKKQL